MNKQEEPRYLIIPAAGLGTRMRSIDPDLPKEMLPVGDKPAIQYAVDEGISAGIKNIIIIINKQKEIVRRYFEDQKSGTECSFTFLYQKEPLGESDAISYAGDITGSHSAAVIYPDNLYIPSPGTLKALKPVFNKYKKDVIALTEVTENNSPGISNAGRVDISLLSDPVFTIEKFIPKSRGTFAPRFKGELRACGIYISGPYIFDYIERSRNKYTDGELTDLPVRSLILKERGMLGCRLPGTVFDIGNPSGYKKCLEYFKNNTLNNKKIEN